MSRAPRIEGDGLWYHVYNRGNEKRDVFITEQDHRLFLDTLFRSCEMFDVEVHAFVLVSNHFHVMLRTMHANLCRFMHSMMSNFTRMYNASHERVGHVFQGRYRAIVIDSEAYGRELLRYIHLNPTRGGGAAALDMAGRLKVLEEYEWSSHRAYAGLMRCPWPLVTSEMLQAFGTTPASQRRDYLRFMAAGLQGADNLFDHVLGNVILGSELFVARIKELVQHGRADASAAPERRRIVACAFDNVRAAVCDEYGVNPEKLTRRYPAHAHREARRVLLWAVAHYCRGHMTMAELGSRLGGVGGAALAIAHRQIECACITSPRLARTVRAVAQRVEPRTMEELPSGVDAGWWQMYQRLVAYHKRHGHAKVPRGYREDQLLAAWVARQRRLLHEGRVEGTRLSVAQIALLHKLDLMCY